MKKNILFPILALTLGLGTSLAAPRLLAAPVSPPTTSSCTPTPAIISGGGCPSGTPDYYAGQCRAHIDCTSGQTLNCSSTSPCVTPPTCPSGQINVSLTSTPSCKTVVNVITDTLFKVWDGALLKRLVYVDDSVCTNGQVIQWSQTATPPKWVCADAATISGISSVAGNPLFVGLSATLVQGNLGSYTLANNACYNGAGALSQSHICTAGEITDSYVASHVSVTTGTAWINAGSPANTFPAVNDCGGWTQNVNPYYGTVWNFSSKSAAIQPCFATKQYACCK